MHITNIKIISIFLTLILAFFVFSYVSNTKVTFNEKMSRKVGDVTENSLYKIINGSKTFYFATNKVLEDKYLNKNMVYLSSDIFWNPERCAQMMSFYTEDKIYFFDTEVVNPEEHNGQYFSNLLHVYDLETKILKTYQSDKYINISGVEKRFIENKEGKLNLYLQDKNYKNYVSKFDFNNLEITKNCSFLSCDYLPDTQLITKIDNEDFTLVKKLIDFNHKDFLSYFFIGGN